MPLNVYNLKVHCKLYGNKAKSRDFVYFIAYKWLDSPAVLFHVFSDFCALRSLLKWNRRLAEQNDARLPRFHGHLWRLNRLILLTFCHKFGL
jgi:hypothetical protein